MLVINATHQGVNMINILKKNLFICLLAIGFGQNMEIITGQGKVTYLTADQVYCDIGTSQGVSVGDTLQLFRRSEIIGDLVITHSAKNSSVSSPLVPIESIQIGDRVQFEKTNVIIPDSPIAPATNQPQKPEKEKLKLNQSGHLSIRSTIQSLPDGVSEQSGIGTLQYGLSAPALKHFKIGIYGRSNLQNQQFTLYQARASFGIKNKGPFFQLGRVFASELSGIGATDGLLATSPLMKNIIIGGLGGLQPDPESYQFKTNIKKLGLFSKVKFPKHHFTGSIAFVGQYAGSDIDREFIYSKMSYSPINQLSVKLYQTFDFYRNNPVYNREILESTFSQFSLKIKLTRKITFRSRYTSRQQIIYQQSQILVPDSLFQSELKNGWYNAFKVQTKRWGILQLGSNFRRESGTDQYSSVRSFNYRTNPTQNGLSIDWNSIMIQNQLLKGFQNKWGISKPILRNGFFNADYEIYTFGFGNNWNDFTQHTFSISISKKIGKYLNMYTSIDYSKDADYTRSFGYFGLTYRF